MNHARPLSTRLIVLLATSPSLRLTAEEIAKKFSVNKRYICTTLRYPIKNGWIMKYQNTPRFEYGAGPVLLEELGEL